MINGNSAVQLGWLPFHVSRTDHLSNKHAPCCFTKRRETGGISLHTPRYSPANQNQAGSARPSCLSASTTLACTSDASPLRRVKLPSNANASSMHLHNLDLSLVCTDVTCTDPFQSARTSTLNAKPDHMLLLISLVLWNMLYGRHGPHLKLLLQLPQAPPWHKNKLKNN